MQEFEPLYYGIDVDAVKAQMDAEDRRRASARHAGARRSSAQRSPRLRELEGSLAFHGMIDRASLAPRGLPIA
jgi:hypothetical protein